MVLATILYSSMYPAQYCIEMTKCAIFCNADSFDTISMDCRKISKMNLMSKK